MCFNYMYIIYNSTYNLIIADILSMDYIGLMFLFFLLINFNKFTFHLRERWFMC